MFCPSCGSKVPEGTKFCEKCGMPIKEAFENQNSQPQQQTVYEKVQSSETTQKIKDEIEKLGLTKFQKAVAIVSASTALAFLICITGTFVSWVTALSALFLTFLCVKKNNYDTIPMAIAFSVFAFRFLIVDLFMHANLTVLSVLIHLIVYGCAVVYWLSITGVFKKKELGFSIFLLGNAISAIYAFIHMFMAMSDSFRSVLFYLGWLGFIAVYGMLIVTDNKTIPYIKELFSGANKQNYPPQYQSYTPYQANNAAQYCPKCGAGQPVDATFCDKCGTKLAVVENNAPTQASNIVVEQQPTVSKEPEYIICQKCGSKLEKGSLFCDRCGSTLATEEEKPVEVVKEPPTVVVAPEPVVAEEPKTEAPKIEEPIQNEVVEETNTANKIVCAKCGSILEEGSVFCDKCGTPIAKQEETKQETVINTKLICSKCGAELEDGSMFCDKCGTPVSNKAGTKQTPIVNTKLVCPKCGTELEDGSAFCDNCGTKI